MANTQLNLKFVINKKGGQNLAYNGFIYRIIRRNGEKSCRGSLSALNNIPVAFGRQEHNHPADHAEVVAQQIRNSITKRCLEEVRPIPAIYEEELRKLRDEEWDEDCKAVVQRLPTFNTAKSSLYRARRKETPVLPKTLSDIRLEGKWTETSTRDRFLLFDDGDQQNRIIAFATTENLRYLSTADTFYCDGTFYTWPSLFHQIYSIHVVIDGRMTPVVFALLPGKSQRIYTRLFTLLKEHMTQLYLPFAPTHAFADFEVAVHNAIHQTFPGITMKGFFHFTHNVWKKAQTTGLQTLYRDNEDVRTLIRRAAVLPLVPMDCIEDVWLQTLEDLEDAEVPQNTTPFTDYVTEQWVEGDRPLWNHFQTDGPRTTNNLEAWHGKLKKVKHAHPTIFAIIQTFKEIDNADVINRMQREAGGTPDRVQRSTATLTPALQHSKKDTETEPLT
ncbi:uncharacterized protein LOC132565428 [Ylistrum balloti]|uniref:uncharacterized protein LOC132565428 n=1 Tax=Ylistrum balloti TaxID=509963 RepID=UPI002905D0EE|nr:uncharacterized protein LOC132565428 [Ylistrum balloti]